MGLESFKTEGPRTFTKKKKNASPDNVVHVIKGVPMEDVEVPTNVTKHRVFHRDRFTDLTASDENTFCICEHCDSISSSYPTMLTVDKLDFLGSDWYPEFEQQMLDALDSLDFELTLDEASSEWRDSDIVEQGESNEVQSTADEDDDISSGLASFKT